MPHAYADQDDGGSVPFRSPCGRRFFVRATLSIPRRPRPTHAVAAAAGSPPDAGGSVGVQRGVAAPAVDRSTDRLQGKPVALPGF